MTTPDETNALLDAWAAHCQAHDDDPSLCSECWRLGHAIDELIREHQATKGFRGPRRPGQPTPPRETQAT